MIIPKVEFVYSWPYDEAIFKAKNLLFDFDKYWHTAQRFISKLEARWRPLEKKVLGEASRIAGLKWKEQVIKCYVSTYDIYVALEDPLSIGRINVRGKKLNIDEYIDVLVHELLHHLVHYEKGSPEEPANEKFKSKYAKEKYKTQAHILLQAIHKHLFLKFFGEKRLEQEISCCKKYKPSYYRAWQIVEKEGYKNIIARFRKYLKAK